MRQILIVDDDENLLSSMGEFLELSTGVKCHCFKGLEELILHKTECCSSNTILAIVDINLGLHKPSGIEVYRWLLANHFPGKIVFLTGHAKDHPLVMEASLIGETEVFAKPLDSDRFVSLIEERGHA